VTSYHRSLYFAGEAKLLSSTAPKHLIRALEVACLLALRDATKLFELERDASPNASPNTSPRRHIHGDLRLPLAPRSRWSQSIAFRSFFISHRRPGSGQCSRSGWIFELEVMRPERDSTTAHPSRAAPPAPGRRPVRAIYCLPKLPCISEVPWKWPVLFL
jgi:hypothetical protein